MKSDAMKVYESFSAGNLYGVIYLLIDPNECRVKYIGQTTKDPESRMFEHLRDARKGGKRINKKQKWLCDLIENGQLPILRIVHAACTQQELNYMEIAWFHYFNETGHEPLNGQQFISSKFDDMVDFVKEKMVENDVEAARNVVLDQFYSLMKAAREEHESKLTKIAFENGVKL